MANSQSTIIKQSFYLMFECLVRSIEIGQLLGEREIIESEISGEPAEKTIKKVDDKVKDLLGKVDQKRHIYQEKVLENIKSNRIESVPNADLAIILVMMCEIERGLDKKVALQEATDLADAFGGTDTSADFIYAVLSKVA